MQSAVHFATNQATLTPESENILRPLLQQMQQLPYVVAEISGHADSTGPVEFNRALSQRRADAVKQFFVDGGIDPDRITVLGLGESEPLADNTTTGGRRENRRVDIVLKAPPTQ